MGKKLTIEFVKQNFEKENYKLLTTTYKNSRQKLKYICPKGHRGNISWNSWESGSRCLECSGKKKKDIELIKQEFEKENYKLLTTTYKNGRQNLEYICPKGHRGNISWDSWKMGRRCLECSGLKKKTIEFIRQEFEKERYRLLTKEYKNNKQKLEYICPKGHRSSISWNNWREGYRCVKCWCINISGSNSCHWRNYTNEKIKQLTEYRANVTQLTRQNFCKYYYYVNPNNFPRGRNLYHVDHIFSIMDGFNNGMLPKIVASPINLQMLIEKENIAKSDRSDMTKEMLYDLYDQFEREVKE